jgi:hypothetical protein
MSLNPRQLKRRGQSSASRAAQGFDNESVAIGTIGSSFIISGKPSGQQSLIIIVWICWLSSRRTDIVLPVSILIIQRQSLSLKMNISLDFRIVS